jgi:hypothetical protein
MAVDKLAATMPDQEEDDYSNAQQNLAQVSQSLSGCTEEFC